MTCQSYLEASIRNGTSNIGVRIIRANIAKTIVFVSPGRSCFFSFEESLDVERRMQKIRCQVDSGWSRLWTSTLSPSFPSGSGSWKYAPRTTSVRGIAHLPAVLIALLSGCIWCSSACFRGSIKATISEKSTAQSGAVIKFLIAIQIFIIRCLTRCKSRTTEESRPTGFGLGVVCGNRLLSSSESSSESPPSCLVAYLARVSALSFGLFGNV